MPKCNSHNRLSLAAFLFLGAPCLWSQNPTTVNVTGPIVQNPPASGNLQNYLLTNGYNRSDQTLLDPGILFYNSGSYSWGADLGSNPVTGRYRTRLFAAPTGDIAFSFTNSPTSQSSFNDFVVIRGDSGNMGIGTPTPGAKLEVNGGITLTNGSHGVLTFPDGSVQTTASTGGGGAASLPAITQVGSNVGIGTINPLGTLTIASPDADEHGTAAHGLVFVDSTQNGAPWTHAAIYSSGSYGYNGSLVFATDGDGLNNFGVTEKMRISPNGSVGIGTYYPAAKLEVNGNLKLTSGSGASITYADGTVQSTAWTGSLCGGDYAESVDVSGDRSRYQAGDVLVVDVSNPGHFLKASEPYSTLVGGIYSTKPGILGRRQTTDPKTSATEVPMAMVGIVPTKVSAENGPIRVGDLLVSSSTLGYAMKGTDRAQMLGAVIGKALGPLNLGTGVIEVLVTLQ